MQLWTEHSFKTSPEVVIASPFHVIAEAKALTQELIYTALIPFTSSGNSNLYHPAAHKMFLSWGYLEVKALTWRTQETESRIHELQFLLGRLFLY